MDCGDKLIKYILFIFNVVFFLCGIALITIGSILTVRNDYVSLIGYQQWDLYVAIIVAGCITTIISFFGCCGAMRQNSCMVYTFAALLTLAFLFELGGSIAAFILQDDIADNMETSMYNSMDDYTTNPDVADQWDDLQQRFKCCGVNAPSDWTKEIPPSCWVDEDRKGVIPDFQVGCFKEMSSEIQSDAWIIAGVALGVAVIQLVGVGFACCLGKAIKKDRRGHLV